MQTEITSDPAMLFPLVCVVAGVDFGSRLPERGGVSAEPVTAQDIQSFLDANGLTLDGECADGETTAKPAGWLLKINLAKGAEFSLIRPLTLLNVADSVSVTENYSDRHVLRAWTNALVHAPPKKTFLAHAGGPEFYALELEFLIIGGTP